MKVEARPFRSFSRDSDPKVVGIGWPIAAILVAFLCSGAASASGTDSCVDCHRDPDLLVTNKKLYDYYQQWEASIHKQEDVACSDCHGGNSDALDKKKAHGRGVGVADVASGVYYKNVSETCGECHDEILEGFQTSEHFKHVRENEDEKQGPTCVTCHGSINVGILNVNTVESVCERCHNEERDNLPENPAKAKKILNSFLSIDRFYRYISIRIDPKEARSFFKEADARHQHLSVTWHTFDLDKIGEETAGLLNMLKAKREELRNKTSGDKKR